MNWTVTDQEADYILQVLAGRPFAEVGQLIPNLVRQSQPAMQQEIPGMDVIPE